MVMPCKVLKTTENKKEKKIKLKLTVNPREINSHMSAVNIKNGLVGIHVSKCYLNWLNGSHSCDNNFGNCWSFV